MMLNSYKLINFNTRLQKLLRLPILGTVDWEGMEKTIAEHEKHVARLYPIRYFLTYTLFDHVVYPVDRTIRGAYWWLRYHTTDRYHILDLRQSSHTNHFHNSDHYAYGWRDTDTRMLYAMFNLLCQFVEHELDNIDVSAAYLVERPELENQYKACTEIKALYHYWKVERHELQRQYDQALDEWSKIRRSENKEQVDAVWKELDQLEKQKDETEDAMLMRLLKVRRFMWS